jgi:hypothetical protein
VDFHNESHEKFKSRILWFQLTDAVIANRRPRVILGFLCFVIRALPIVPLS